jgi:hypothetical protein
MAIQCTLPQEPKALDKGVAWYVYIDKPFEANAGEMVTITGSVWIDKTTASNLMDFGSYRMYYQIPDAEDWLEIPVDSLHEKRNEPLAIWNTTGLLPGQYLLKLVLTDNWGNSIEGVKSIMLLPVFGIAEKNPDDLWVYPNPAGKLVHIQRSNSSGTTEVKIQNFLGETLILKQFSASELIMGCSFSLETLATGTYVISVTDTGKCLTRQLIVR